ncbi:hypothetical protein C8R43DRAFT_20465, partial [Mycena crocata]
ASGSVPSTPTSSSASASASPTSCTKFTTVQPGDSCDAIAQRSAVSIYNLQHINPTIPCSGLISGQAICIDSPLVNCSAVYTVDGTEGGCSNIAAAHGIAFPTLVDLNPNINSGCTNIYVGEVLCTAPDGAATPPDMQCTRHYTVVTGDTCTVIAAKNSITNLQLQSLNPSLNCNGL